LSFVSQSGANQQITWLISALCTHKCLVILDEIHYLFQSDMIAVHDRSADDLPGDGDSMTRATLVRTFLYGKKTFMS